MANYMGMSSASVSVSDAGGQIYMCQRQSASAVSVANFMDVSSASAVSVANFMGMSSASVSISGQLYMCVVSVGQRRRCRWYILCVYLQCRSASAVSVDNFMVVSPEWVSVGGVGGQFHVSVFSVGQRQRCR